MWFSHIGLPTTGSSPPARYLPHLKMTVSDHRSNPFGLQWQRYDAGAPYPALAKTIAHAAFELDDPGEALAGHEVIIEPNRPSPGVQVALIQVDGAPVGLLEIDPSAGEEARRRGTP